MLWCYSNVGSELLNQLVFWEAPSFLSTETEVREKEERKIQTEHAKGRKKKLTKENVTERKRKKERLFKEKSNAKTRVIMSEEK